jgi:hypothetical protein
MTDPLADLLRGIDGPRPLPPAVRAGIEARLRATPVSLSTAMLDAPRTLPGDLHDRIEAALTASAPSAPGALGAGRRSRAVAPLLVAAAVVLLLATTVAVIGSGRAAHETAQEPVAGASTTTAIAGASEAGAVAGAEPGSAAGPGTVRSGSGGTSSGAASSVQAAGPAPPYAFAAEPTIAESVAPGSKPAPLVATTMPRAALRVAIVGGDAEIEAGFRAYVQVLNDAGGAGGHRLTLAPAGPGAPVTGAVATVNLGPTPIATSSGAPAWVTGPLLEATTATEDILRGRTYAFASALEREAHLIADAVFPQPAPGTTAAVYHRATGPFSGAAANAVSDVLRARNVTPVDVTYDPSTPAVLVPADAAFLLLTAADASALLKQAKSSGYAPQQGFAGIGSLDDENLLPDLPDGTRIITPYASPGRGDEAAALRRGANRPLTTGVRHGWYTAKALAVALWQSGADTAAGAQSALDRLPGYDGGIAPPYAVRAGTHSRTPEGFLLTVAHRAFTGQPGWRRDLR